MSVQITGLLSEPVRLRKPVLKLVFERAARPAPAGDDAVLRFFELDVGFWKTRDIGIQNSVDHHVIVVEMKKTDVVRITGNK